MNRRDMLRTASAGIALMVLPGSLATALSSDPGRSKTVIYDERFVEARAFAEHIGCRGAVLLPTRGDATGLWYGGPGSSLWQAGGGVAGVTTYPDLVIARSRGRELGLRLALEEPLARCFDATGPAVVERSGHLLIWLLLPRRAGSPLAQGL